MVFMLLAAWWFRTPSHSATPSRTWSSQDQAPGSDFINQ
jgi:hypothetical protein